jgi:hypothetical protein
MTCTKQEFSIPTPHGVGTCALTARFQLYQLRFRRNFGRVFSVALSVPSEFLRRSVAVSHCPLHARNIEISKYRNIDISNGVSGLSSPTRNFEISTFQARRLPSKEQYNHSRCRKKFKSNSQDCCRMPSKCSKSRFSALYCRTCRRERPEKPNKLR